jgi:hypothetical protein
VENWFGLLCFAGFVRCAVVGMLIASIAVSGIGIREIVVRGRTQAEGDSTQEHSSLAGPIFLTVVGGLIFLLILFGIWKYYHDVVRPTRLREVVSCQEVSLADGYELNFYQRRDDTLLVVLKEHSIGQNNLRQPVDEIVQFDVSDHYIVGLEDSGHWFIVDLDQERSERYFPTENNFLAELAKLDLTREPAFSPAQTYCETHLCQPCSAGPDGS